MRSARWETAAEAGALILPERVERRNRTSISRGAQTAFLFSCDSDECMEIREDGIRIAVPKGVFYNPEMELCRSLCSLALGSLPGKLSLIDAMCASGVRGIRYAREHRNA